MGKLLTEILRIELKQKADKEQTDFKNKREREDRDVSRSRRSSEQDWTIGEKKLKS